MERAHPSEHERKPLLAGKLALLASVAALTGAITIGGSAGYWASHGTALAAPVQTTERAGPQGFADIVQRVKPAVVSVRVRLKEQQSGNALSSNSPLEEFFRNFGMPEGGQRMQQFALALGSAFFISPDGYALTNNHVVQNAQAVEITTDSGKTYTAKVVGTDPKTDLALIKVEGRSDFPYVRFADGAPRVGDWVIAVGNPYGLGGTVTAGIVSAQGRDIGAGPYDDFIQIDAPVNKGNSGGPAFDESGNVVGVTTAIFSPSGGSVGIGFAIPAETAKFVVEQLKEHGSITRGWIGVQIQTVTQDIAESLGLKSAEGALVAEPQRDSPAAKAGITAGDLIQSVNGQPVKDARDLAQKIAAVRPGTAVEVGLLRNGSQKTVSVAVAKMPNENVAQNQSSGAGQSEGSSSLGLTIAPASSVAGEGSQGVVVTNVNPGGPAAEHGIRTGDVILDVSGKAVNTPVDVRKALQDARSGGKQSVLMRIKSGDNTHFVALPLAAG